jgi:signal transduction histidine kinase
MFRAALAEIKPPSNIKITASKDLPIVICEEEHVYQIFYQLLGNAVRFMDKTDGRVTIDYADEDQFWRFSISDNGPGIEQQHFERIFQLFQTLNSRDEAEDTGVGLALVKKIVELYGGRIWLISHPGQGTTFNFTLPKQQASINPQIPQFAATGQQQ